MPKQVIDLSKSARNLSFLFYGDSRTGKTRMLATFPKPLIIADASEKGYETVRWMKLNAPELFYDPEVVPEVWAVDNAAGMGEALGDAEAGLRADPNRWRTVGFDSLTFYADSLLSQIIAGMGEKYNPRQAYGTLGFQLNYLMTRGNQLPAHVVWTALAKHPETDDKGHTSPAGLLLAGQTAGKAPARCNYWFYFDSFGAAHATQFRVHTKRFGAYPAGGRDMGQLDEPLSEAHYRAIESGLGVDPFVDPKKPQKTTTNQASRGSFSAPPRK